MATPTQWLGPTQVNTGLAATGTQSDSKVIGLANNTFLVIWTEASNGVIAPDPGSDIVGKIYAADGTVLRDAFRVNTDRTSDTEHLPDISATHDGFVMAYVDEAGGGTNQSSIIYERFDLDGDRQGGIGTAFVVDNETVAADFLSNPAIAANMLANNDDIFVAYDDDVGTNTDVNGRIINENGAMGAEFGVGQNSTPTYDRIEEAEILSNGSFVAVYNEQDAGGNSTDLRIFDETGALVSAVGNIAGSTSSQVTVTGLAGDGLALAYTNSNDIWVHIFQNDGTPVTTFLAASGANSQNEPAITNLHDGGFVVAWDDDTSNQLVARRFNADGSANGSFFTVAASVTAIDMSTTADGRILFTWRGVASPEIFTAVWDPRNSAIDPDDYNIARTNFLMTDVVTTNVVGSTVLAGAKGDTILGQNGDDTIFSSGSGAFHGGGGDDEIFVSASNFETDDEILDGGLGQDTLNIENFFADISVNLATGANSKENTTILGFEHIIGGDGNDEFFGTGDENTIEGGGGNDRILGQDGDDFLDGGIGDDTLNGGEGGDTIVGGDGDDIVYAEGGDDKINGGEGNDLIEAKLGDDTLSGEAGNDILRASDGEDTVEGGTGNDTAFGGNDDDELRGGLGDDSLDGNGGDDRVEGGLGNDVVIGGTGVDTLEGGEGNDTLRGGGGDDWLEGGADNDVLFGSSGVDTLNGGDGNDTLEGNAQSDELNGDGGNDVLRGGDGFDTLDGGIGDDILAGGNGVDILIGGLGVDILRGNAQADIFVFTDVNQSTSLGSDLVDGYDGIGVASGDVIDLTAIDANNVADGNNAFTFLGLQTTASGQAFGAGGLWLENAGNQTHVFGNIDNDGVIDLVIRINDGAVFSAADYIAIDFLL